MTAQDDFVKLIQDTIRQENARSKAETKAQIDTVLTPAIQQLRGYALLEEKLNNFSQIIAQQMQTIAQQVDVLRRETAITTKVQTENKQLLAQIEKASSDANKALDLLRLAGEIEQQQYVDTQRLDNEETSFRDGLKKRRMEMEADFDLRKQALQAGRGQYFEELDAELKRIVKETKKGEEPEIKAVPDKEKRLPKIAIAKNNNDASDSLPDLD